MPPPARVAPPLQWLYFNPIKVRSLQRPLGIRQRAGLHAPAHLGGTPLCSDCISTRVADEAAVGAPTRAAGPASERAALPFERGGCPCLLSIAGRAASLAMAEPTSETATPPAEPVGRAIFPAASGPTTEGSARPLTAVELGLGGAVDAVARPLTPMPCQSTRHRSGWTAEQLRSSKT